MKAVLDTPGTIESATSVGLERPTVMLTNVSIQMRNLEVGVSGS